MQDRSLGLYVIYDLLAGEIVANTASLFPHVAPARRMFQDVVRAGKGPIAEHPQDYALCYLGIVSVATLMIADVGIGKGIEMTAGHPQVVCTGSQVLE